MRDLHEVLAGSLAARERAMAGELSTDDVLAGTVSRVRRRRRARAAAWGGAVLGVGALVVGVGWGVLRPMAVAPATPPTVSATPTPSATPSAAPTPSPTVSPTQEPVATMVPVLGLGDLPQATEATLARATTGWAIVHYSRQGPWTSGGSNPDLVDALLLADPGGALYYLSDPPSTWDVPFYMIGRWSAGSRTATVAVENGPSEAAWFQTASLDLLTGAVNTDPVEREGRPVGLLPDGRWLTEAPTTDGSGDTFRLSDSGGDATTLATIADVRTESSLSPDGSQVRVETLTGYAVVDTATGEVVEHSWPHAGRSCDLSGWLDDQRVAVVCGASADPLGESVTEPTRDVVRVVDGVVLSSTPLSAGQVWPTSWMSTSAGLLSVGNRLGSGSGSSGALPLPRCATAAMRWMPDGSTSDVELPSWDGGTMSVTGSGGRYAYVTEVGCSADGPQRVSVSAVDVRSGTSHQLLDSVDVGVAGWLEVLVAQ